MSWGGKREGSGRKKFAQGERPQHQVRAYADEWILIKKFAKIVKHGDKQAAIKFLENQSSSSPE